MKIDADLAKAPRGVPIELSLPLYRVQPREEVVFPVDIANAVSRH